MLSMSALRSAGARGLLGVGGKASRDALSVVWSLAGALVQGVGSREESRADRGRVGPPEL